MMQSELNVVGGLGQSGRHGQRTRRNETFTHRLLPATTLKSVERTIQEPGLRRNSRGGMIQVSRIMYKCSTCLVREAMRCYLPRQTIHDLCAWGEDGLKQCVLQPQRAAGTKHL